MTNLTLKVEGSPGAECTEIIREMSRLASRLGIMVACELNGVHTTAKPFCDARKLCEDWQEAMTSGRKYVCGQPATLATFDARITKETISARGES